MLNVPITCILYESTIEEASEDALLDCACGTGTLYAISSARFLSKLFSKYAGLQKLCYSF